MFLLFGGTAVPPYFFFAHPSPPAAGRPFSFSPTPPPRPQAGQSGGVMNERQLTEAIEAVSQPEREGFLGTAWTMVMDLKHPSVTYYSRRHFDKPLHFELKK